MSLQKGNTTPKKRSYILKKKLADDIKKSQILMKEQEEKEEGLDDDFLSGDSAEPNILEQEEDYAINEIEAQEEYYAEV